MAFVWAALVLSGCSAGGDTGDPCVRDADCREADDIGGELGCIACQNYVTNGTPTCGATSVLVAGAVSPQFVADYCARIGGTVTPPPAGCTNWNAEERRCEDIVSETDPERCTTDARFSPYGDIQIDGQCQAACL